VLTLSYSDHVGTAEHSSAHPGAAAGPQLGASAAANRALLLHSVQESSSQAVADQGLAAGPEDCCQLASQAAAAQAPAAGSQHAAAAAAVVAASAASASALRAVYLVECAAVSPQIAHAAAAAALHQTAAVAAAGFVQVPLNYFDGI